MNNDELLALANNYETLTKVANDEALKAVIKDHESIVDALDAFVEAFGSFIADTSEDDSLEALLPYYNKQLTILVQTVDVIRPKLEALDKEMVKAMSSNQ